MSITGSYTIAGSVTGRGGEPGVAFERAGDGVEGGQAVGEGGIKVAANAGPLLQGGDR